MKVPSYSLRQLVHFVAVAEAGTLSAAADRLNVSQPGLSQSITELERTLDVQLLIRRRAHGVTLTPSGAQVLRHARDLLHRTQDLQSAAAGGPELSGTLSLGCYVTLAPTVLPALLQGFSALHPAVTVDFTEDTQDVLQRRMLTGELDLSVLYDMELRPDLERVVISEVKPHLLLAGDHPLADALTVPLAAVVDEPQVLLDAPPSSHNTLAIFERFGLVPRVCYRPTTFEVARSLVGRGMGYALLVQRPSNDRTYEGRRVVIKEIAEPVSAYRVVAAWPRDTRLHRRAEAFVRFCVATAERAAGDDVAP